MEVFGSYYSEPHPFVTPNSCLYEVPDESSSTFDHEEVLLASKNPKKRAGRKKFRETRHPVYRGVRRRNCDKWVCEIREPNKKSRIWLGTFPTPEMAARAHDVAALALKGHSACLNFADSAWRVPIPASANTKDIQKAAAEAAQAFHPSTDRDVKGETLNILPDNVLFIEDEEEIFNMHMLLANMAEGLMMPLPYTNCVEEDEGLSFESYNDSLWSHSI